MLSAIVFKAGRCMHHARYVAFKKTRLELNDQCLRSFTLELFPFY